MFRPRPDLPQVRQTKATTYIKTLFISLSNSHFNWCYIIIICLTCTLICVCTGSTASCPQLAVQFSVAVCLVVLSFSAVSVTWLRGISHSARANCQYLYICLKTLLNLIELLTKRFLAELKQYPLAIYWYCASHCLNLVTVKSLQVKRVRSMMCVVGRVYQFFAAHPKYQRALEKAISDCQPSSTAHN